MVTQIEVVGMSLVLPPGAENVDFSMLLPGLWT